MKTLGRRGSFGECSPSAHRSPVLSPVTRQEATELKSRSKPCASKRHEVFHGVSRPKGSGIE